jgi:ubiquitin-large subunit ribosomal protein L40e
MLAHGMLQKAAQPWGSTISGRSLRDWLDGSLVIFVATLTAEILKFAVEPTTTIELKDMIAGREGTPADDQRLIFAGKQLEDKRRLSECGIRCYSKLNMVLRLRGC